MATTEKKVAIETWYMYAHPQHQWYSTEHYESQEAATDAALARMKSEIEKGYQPISLVIVRADRHRIYDEFMVISEQYTRTTVEMISKDYVSSLKYLGKEDN